MRPVLRLIEFAVAGVVIVVVLKTLGIHSDLLVFITGCACILIWTNYRNPPKDQRPEP